ncbi:galactose mutarotase [Aureimonas flava]|uniref:Aldose 1-epimerase n=1 Tax=Aureimonas flava TaxID=2320271 RepID=A0A3A1WX78_9HYPH|nr:aldose epimerase family protein [Aureimonas flava]RIY03339.1 galactose mutarotase [Aureimonas flava]
MSEASGIERQDFGRLPDGRAVEMVRLRAAGIEACILTYGATLQTLRVPDRDGRMDDVVLGHDALDGYVATRDFFGATIGRFANRIADGRFALDGERFQIPPNDGPNALHGGGPEGFDRHLWTIEETGGGDAPFVGLSRVSPDGECGFPGRLEVRVTYRLRAGEMEIAFEASTDRPTVVNLTNHAFFNLGGTERVTGVLAHEIAIEADRFLPVGEGAIPRGEPAPVEGTAFDFRVPRAIGERIRAEEEQIRQGRGYDHNWCLRGASGTEPRLAATLRDPASGRVMELLTDQPGVQFYSGNFLDGTAVGKHGLSYRMGDAVCLEPQGFPDAPNRPDFPTARLDPGETYRHRSIYRFTHA